MQWINGLGEIVSCEQHRVELRKGCRTKYVNLTNVNRPLALLLNMLQTQSHILEIVSDSIHAHHVKVHYFNYSP
jgi:hypothetical protein